jgi:hypothetical protein
MNFFARFVRSLKALRLIVVTNQEIGSKLCHFDFDTQFSIAQQIFNSQKGVPEKKTD